MEAPVVEAHGLSKHYGTQRAVDGLSLRVNRGEIFGLFGPNGAGKSTTLRLITGLTEPTAGGAKVCGFDVHRDRDRLRGGIAILPENPTPDAHLKPEAYLLFCSALRGQPASAVRTRARELLDVLGIPSRDKRIAHLSMGQRQRVEIARVLLDPSPLMVLDEPFNALDLDTRRSLMARLRAEVKAGRSIVYTSHHLLEAEQFVDRFGFLRAGKLAAVGKAADIKRKFLAARFRIAVSQPEAAVKRIQSIAGIREAVAGPDGALAVVVDEHERIAEVVRRLVEAGHGVTEVVPQGSLEDLFDQFKDAPRKEALP